MVKEEEAQAARDAARRVLQAAAVEAFGRPGAYVMREHVMRRANIEDLEEFARIAKYLEARGWIEEPDADYGVFVITASGVEEAMNERGSLCL